MTSRILAYSQSAVCLISDIEKEWTKRNLSICKTADFEDAVKELKYHLYLLIVFTLNNENVEQAQNQIKILRSLNNAPIAVITDDTVQSTEKVTALLNGADLFIGEYLPRFTLFFRYVRYFMTSDTVSFPFAFTERDWL